MEATTDHHSVDLAHLARQTGGNEALGRDVLRLFLEGTVADFQRLKQATGSERREVAHLILGSARAIGAEAVATAAAAVEAGNQNLSNLESALAAANQFIATYLAR